MPMESQADITHIFSKVVGVTFKNSDRTSRQKVIRECAVGERLNLETDRSPEYPLSLAVTKQDGRQLGFLDARLAEDLIKRNKKSGTSYTVFIKDITGGDDDDDRHTRGVNLLIVQSGPEVGVDQIGAYVRRQFAPPEPTPAAGGCITMIIVSVLLTAICLTRSYL